VAYGVGGHGINYGGGHAPRRAGGWCRRGNGKSLRGKGGVSDAVFADRGKGLNGNTKLKKFTG